MRDDVLSSASTKLRMGGHEVTRRRERDSLSHRAPIGRRLETKMEEGGKSPLQVCPVP